MKFKKRSVLCGFTHFINNDIVNAKSILKFHKTAGKGNSNYGVVMDRTSVKTTSITQIEKFNNTLTMRYEDLNTGLISIKKLQLTNE